jgi:hypothetical protein
MFFIFYKKSDKKIVLTKYEAYAGKEGALTPQQQLQTHCLLNDLNADDFSAVELAYDRNFVFVVGNHVYNETTQQIEADPNYVAPTPEPAEPTA